MSNKSSAFIAASILSADFANLGAETQAVLQAGADGIHFDVMDHHFVPNLSFGAIVCEALRRHKITAPIDVHLMVDNPLVYADPFAKAGANLITFHPETVEDIEQAIAHFQQYQLKVGLAYNPDKPLNLTPSILQTIDFILIMSVFPGFGGQAFIADTLIKVSEARQLIQTYNPQIQLGIDGGIKVDTIGSAAQAGADFFVVGSGLFNANHYATRINELRHAIAA